MELLLLQVPEALAPSHRQELLYVTEVTCA